MKSPDRSIGLKERVVRSVAATGVCLVGTFGIDQWGRTVNAANTTPTRTSTPTATSTPNASATRVAGLEQEKKSLQEQLDLQQKGDVLEKEVACLRGALNRTPCPTATPSSTPTWTLEQIEGKIRAGLITATPTPGPRLPEIIPTPEKVEKTGSEDNQGGGIPGIFWFILGVGGVGALGWARRQQIIDRIRQGIDRIRDRFPGGGAPDAGGAPEEEDHGGDEVEGNEIRGDYVDAEGWREVPDDEVYDD